MTALDTPEDIQPICETKQVQTWTDELKTTGDGIGVFKIRKACMDDNTVGKLGVFCSHNVVCISVSSQLTRNLPPVELKYFTEVRCLAHPFRVS